jgi:hypothetical protein
VKVYHQPTADLSACECRTSLGLSSFVTASAYTLSDIMRTAEEIDWAAVEKEAHITPSEIAIPMLLSKFGAAAPSHFEELGPDFLVPFAQLDIEPPELDVEDYEDSVGIDSDDDDSYEDGDTSNPWAWRDSISVSDEELEADLGRSEDGDKND